MKKKHQSVLLIAVLVIVAAAVVGAGAFLMARYSESREYMDGGAYFGISGDTEAAIVVNGTVLEEKALIAGGEVYFSYSFVSEEIYAGFYYDADVALLRYTTQENDVTWEIDGADGTLIGGPDGEIYVALSMVAEYTGLSAEFYSSPARVVINTEEEVYTALVSQDTALRYRGGIKSDILKDLAEGETVIWVSDIDGKWANVYTEDGFNGYVKKSDIEISETPVKQDVSTVVNEFDHILLNEKIAMVWHYVDNDENNALLDEFLANERGLNVICPTWITLSDDEGGIISWADESYMEKARAAGLYVWVMVDDINGEGDAAAVINSHDARQRLVSALISETLKYGADGINVDFEALNKSDIPAFIQFLKELTNAAHANGLIVSVDNFVPTYTRYYNRKIQAEIVDYIVIMGYDEHTNISSEAGSVASLPFVRIGIEETMEEVNASQVILGVPFYTRGWTYDTYTGELSSSVMGMAPAREFAEEHGLSLNWHETYAQYVGSSIENGVEYSIWMEEARSLSEKVALADDYGLAGVSAWRLGYETEDVWDVFEEYMNKQQ